jgi:hypothetical protein
MLGCTIAAMLYARRQTEAIYGTEQARTDWQEWVKAAQKQEAGEGPIRRRAPTTDTPPALILMRDYFITCFTGALVISSALFWSLAFLLHGVLTSKPLEVDPDS